MLPHVVELRLLGGLRASLLAQLVHLRRDGGLERVDALARERADAVELRVDGAVRELVATGRGNGVGAYALGELLANFLGAGNVDLVCHDDARAGREVARVQLELAVDHLVVVQGIAPLVVAREVDHVHDERGALDVAEELVPKPAPLVRALDKAGDVGADEAQVTARRHAQIRDKRRERVVADLRSGRRDLRDERGLPRRRHAHKRRVGHELHLKLDPLLLRRLAQLGERGSTARGRDEVHVSAAADAAERHGDALAVVREVGDELARFLRFLEVLVDHRAHGHLQDHVLAVGAAHARALAVRAALGLEVVLEAVVDQRRDAQVGLDDDVAAVTAVAAVGAAFGDVRLATEGHAARAAVAAFDVYAYLVYEHGESFAARAGIVCARVFWIVNERRPLICRGRLENRLSMLIAR